MKRHFEDYLYESRFRLPKAFRDDGPWIQQPYPPVPEGKPYLIYHPRHVDGPLVPRLRLRREGGRPEVPVGESEGEWEPDQGESPSLDVLAWYRPFHVATDWGIYIREWGVGYLKARLGGREELAIDALYAHEYFHFLTEVAALTGEQSSGSSAYLDFLSPPHRHPLDWCDLSEATANGAMLAAVRGRHGIASLRAFVRRQPHGYRVGESFEPKAGAAHALAAGEAALAAHLIRRSSPCLDEEQLPFGQLLFDRAGKAVHPRDVPVYWVPLAQPRCSPVIHEFLTIDYIEETSSFRKDLRRLGPQASRAWERLKDELAVSTRQGGANLEKLGDGRWSVRMNRSMRAALVETDGRWIAQTVGSHDKVYRGHR